LILMPGAIWAQPAPPAAPPSYPDPNQSQYPPPQQQQPGLPQPYPQQYQPQQQPYPQAGYPQPYPPPGPYQAPPPLQGHHGLLLVGFLGMHTFQGDTGVGLSPGLRLGGLLGGF